MNHSTFGLSIEADSTAGGLTMRAVGEDEGAERTPDNCCKRLVVVVSGC